MIKQWWRDAVIYEVYVRSFADSDGDGVGDLAGVRSRVPYLADLGVDAIWLTPFYTSPMADGGYDVADYRDVDPTLGTLADFDDLVATAHGYGLRVIVDIVPNHTSSAHEWFASALAGDRAARDRYIFRGGRGPTGDRPPNDWESIFGGPAWTRVDGGDWYLHLFDSSQPDLDWSNEDVHAEIEDVLRFWLDRGVDGFRVDVAHGMVKADGLPDVGHAGQIALLGTAELPYFDQDGVHDIYRRWRKILDAYPGDRVAVAEAWSSTPEGLARYVRPDELHQAFNFAYLGAPWDAKSLRRIIDESNGAAGAVGAPSTWVLSNHDVVRHVTRLGGLDRARAAALLMLALPGSAYLYQGEELGLAEVTDLPEEVLADPMWERSGHTQRGRDGCRVPLPWSGASAPYGFGGTPWLPQPDAWAGHTAADQATDPSSTLSLYRAALAARRGIDGELRWLDSPREDVLVFARGDLVVAMNLGDCPVDMDPPGEMVLASGDLDTAKLPPATTAWWRVGKTDR